MKDSLDHRTHRFARRPVTPLRGSGARGFARISRIAKDHGPLALVAMILMAPLVAAFLVSLQSLEEVYSTSGHLLPTNARWVNYVDAFQQLPFARFMINSAIIALASTSGAVLTSAMAGYAFARLPWKHKRFWYLLLIASLLVPAQVLMIPRFLMYESLGWVNTYKPLIVPAWLGGGAFNVLLFSEFFRRFGRQLNDAARIDGASHWDVFWRIQLRQARPVVIVVAMMSFIIHWNAFLDPLIYLSDFRTYPVSVGLRMYQTLSGTWLNLLMAASVMALVPVAVVLAIGHWLLGRTERIGPNAPGLMHWK